MLVVNISDVLSVIGDQVAWCEMRLPDLCQILQS